MLQIDILLYTFIRYSSDRFYSRLGLSSSVACCSSCSALSCACCCSDICIYYYIEIIKKVCEVFSLFRSCCYLLSSLVAVWNPCKRSGFCLLSSDLLCYFLQCFRFFDSIRIFSDSLQPDGGKRCKDQSGKYGMIWNSSAA